MKPATFKKLAVGAGFILVLEALYLVNTGPQTTAPKELTISTTNLPTNALIFIAETKGYFRENGLKINYRKFSLGKNALDDLLKGNSDMSTPYEFPTLKKIYDGEDLLILSALHSANGNLQLVGKKKAGINSVEDLTGKNVGLAKGSNEFFLDSLLQEHGLDSSFIKIVDVDPSKLDETFLNDRIAATVMWNPVLSLIKNKYPSEISTFESETYHESSFIVSKRDFVMENKDTIIAFLKSLKEARDHYLQDKGDSVRIVAEATGESKELIEQSLSYFEPSLGLNNLMISNLTREAEWLKNNEDYPAPLPDIKEHIFSGYLKEVEPDMVTVSPGK